VRARLPEVKHVRNRAGDRVARAVAGARQAPVIFDEANHRSLIRGAAIDEIHFGTRRDHQERLNEREVTLSGAVFVADSSPLDSKSPPLSPRVDLLYILVQSRVFACGILCPSVLYRLFYLSGANQ